ncbi:MAG TPA: hypothetical protein VFI17_03885 [Solirubrobacterales bacterium]|nr:hypothetical protein [Solirubrobacterales bacterium]
MNGPAAENGQDTRPPRGALIVVAVGLVACVVAALAATGKGEGEAAHLEWVQTARSPDSAPVAVPGGQGKMRLTDSSIMATGTNVSGYSLFRAATILRIPAGSPISGSEILCAVKGRSHAEIGQSSGGLRATYPRSSEEGIYKQLVPEEVFIDFSSHGSETAELEILAMPQGFTSEQGVKLEWPEYKIGTERLEYLIAGVPKQELELPFFTIWKATKIPAAEIACTLSSDAGEATVTTQVALKKVSPPIDEQAEEENLERKEEQEEREEEG